MRLRLSVLVVGLLLSACGSSPGPFSDPARTIASSGDIKAAMRGQNTVALHPRACLVRPRPGGFVQTARAATDQSIARVFSEAGYKFGGYHDVAWYERPLS